MGAASTHVIDHLIPNTLEGIEIAVAVVVRRKAELEEKSCVVHVSMPHLLPHFSVHMYVSTIAPLLERRNVNSSRKSYFDSFLCHLRFEFVLYIYVDVKSHHLSSAVVARKVLIDTHTRECGFSLIPWFFVFRGRW